MWMQSQADDVSSQGLPEPSPTPVKLEKPNPDPMVIAGSPIDEPAGALTLSPSLLPPLPPQTAGSPQPRLANISGQAQSAWWGQVPPPIGSSNPINPYDSPKVNNIKAEQTPKLSPVKCEPGTDVVNPYAPTGILPVVPTDNVHRAIEALDGRKRHKWAKSHRNSLLS